MSMFFKQFYLGCLSQASYMIGSEGEAAVVDPKRDIQEYLDEADRQGLAIKHVLETHFHADFVSGHQELAARTGAKIHFGRQARPGYSAVLLADGDEVRVGKVVIQALETPGHTPESVCYLIRDETRDGKPLAVLTGDTLFVGEVGRPDLMGSTMPAETMGGMLYDSLHGKLMKLPDDVAVYPAHGPGSACGRNIGPETSSTIGKERKLNYAVNISDRDAFIRAVAANLPKAPRYFSHDARLNREGPGPIGEALMRFRSIPSRALARMVDQGEVAVLDTRTYGEYGEGHVPGSLNVGLEGRYASWVGTVLDPTTPLILVAATGAEEEAAMRLARVGYENAIGYLQGGVAAWRADDLPVRELPQIDVQTLARQLEAGELQVLDVRGPGEWQDGHISGAIHRPLAVLVLDVPARIRQRMAPLAVVCGSGYRSSLACSLLERMGHAGPLINVTGGMQAWQSASLPVTGSPIQTEE
jgi:glyoxylase-like metal-dependent hydrolase (beta-lactamase superfamily II)